MTPTDELRDELRRLVDESIPDGGVATDTLFTAAQIDALLTAASSLNEAVANAWLEKAAQALSAHDGLTKFSLDQQSFTFLTPEQIREHALAMAAQFRAAPVETGTSGPVIVATGLRAPVFTMGTDGPPIRPSDNWGLP